MENNSMINAVIFLDGKSQQIIKTSFAAFGTQGIRFIDSFSAINDELLSYSNKIIILEGLLSVRYSISDLELYKKLYDITFYYLGTKKHFNILKDIAYCFECDLTTISINTIQAALFKDYSLETASSISYFDKKKVAEEILEVSSDNNKEVLEVAEAYLALNDVYEHWGTERQEILTEMKKLQSENENLSISNARLLDGYKEMVKAALKLNKDLTRYEEIFTKDIYEKLRLKNYPNRPKVIYLKEFEDFLNLEEFLDVLFFVFKLQGRRSVKVLRLFDSFSSRKIATLPQHYTILKNKYTVSDIINNDFIGKSGDYRNVLDSILTNEIGLDLLILVDSKCYDDIVLSGSLMKYNLCREISHLTAYNLIKGNTLVNTGDSDSRTFWGYYDTSKMDKKQKMLYLSSRPVIRYIFESANTELWG